VGEDRGLISIMMLFRFSSGSNGIIWIRRRRRRCKNFMLTTFPANTQRLALTLLSKNPMVYAGYQRGRRRKWKGERGRIQVIRSYLVPPSHWDV
jgi:hypothetical protein